ncbi:MAG: hypothetical protein OXG60_08510 [Chloroflexi bacterium]|nr:hypothetical protein [Chloroflexota bacterium]
MNSVKRLLRPLYAPLVRKYRNHAKLKNQQRVIRAGVNECTRSGKPLKVIIGAGDTGYENWVATDIPAFHVLKHEHWALLFQPASINRMLAEHVFEHLTVDELGQFLRLARLYIAKDGRIRLAVPDGNHPDANYIEHVRPGGIGEGADDHKVLYNSEKIAHILRECGYEFQLLEYFDASGVLHRESWHAEDGFIGRSAAHDERNVGGKLIYTSLIVDCWPRQYGE